MNTESPVSSSLYLTLISLKIGSDDISLNVERIIPGIPVPPLKLELEPAISLIR